MSARTTAHIPRADLESFFTSAASLPSMRHGGTQLSTELPRGALSAAFTAFEPRLAAYRAERAAHCRQTAPGFNVFDFIKPTENVLSDILKFFLEPTASHGQGAFFLRSMIKQLRPDLSVDYEGAVVAREVLTYSIPRNRRLIDVVATLSDFILGIENKKFTGEGKKQIEHYCQHLENIAARPRRPFCLLFLSRTGAEALSIDPELAARYKQNNQLKSWSWERDIPAWLHECHTHCESDKIRHFIDDFRRYIARYLAIQKDRNENHEDE